MASSAPAARLTYVEYLAQEEKSDVKHEFHNGEVFAMADGTIEHAGLAAGFIRELGTALSDRPCRVFSSDLRVQVAATGLATYPDVSVVCGKAATAPEDPNAITNPVLIVEVLSESTEAYDRGAKAAHYRRIPSLKEYALVSQSERLIEVFRRNERGVWELHEFREGKVQLCDVSIDLAAVYANPLA